MLLAKIISEVTSVLFLLSSSADPENEFSEEQPPSLVKLVGTASLLFGDVYQLKINYWKWKSKITKEQDTRKLSMIVSIKNWEIISQWYYWNY